MIVLAAGSEHHVLHPAGPAAEAIHALYSSYLTILTVVYVLVVSALLLALLRRKRAIADAPALAADEIPAWGEPERASRRLDEAGERARQRWVIAATAVTVVVLFVMLTQSVLTGYAIDQLPVKDALEIEVIGHQWWWEVRYRGAEPADAIVTANEIHIPVGRPVVLTLTSNDVIHSFWVPSLHGKRDLVPGHVNTLALRADRPGAYRGQCAEFCGQAHALMGMWVIAEPPASFAKWQDAQRATPPAPTTSELVRGQQVFLGGPCGLCHTVAGTSAQSNAGPDLSHVASRRTLAADTLPNTRGHLAGWLLNAQSLKPGSTMPNIGLSADDLHALIAYLESLR